MKLRFLCGTHRQLLVENPNKAIHCWQDSFDTGQNYYEQGLWEDALPHTGCAFETSEIIMTGGTLAQQCAYEIFTSSSILLARVFEMLGYTAESKEVHTLAIKRLEHESTQSLGDQKKLDFYQSELQKSAKKIGSVHETIEYLSEPELSVA